MSIISIVDACIVTGEDTPDPDLLSDTPPVPPRRRDRERKKLSPPRAISNGLPPTPKVLMGACFSKVSHIFAPSKIAYMIDQYPSYE